MLILSQLSASLLGGLRCFESVGRLGSFTKAAQALNLTQGAVSQQIRKLEERLGYKLFVRQAGGLAVTQKGEALLATTSRAFSEISQTLQRLGGTEAPLRVSCAPSFALQWLMPRLAEFSILQPDIRVRLKAEFQPLDRHVMDVDEIDIAIRYDPVDYSEISADIILSEYLVAVATPEYLERHPAVSNGTAPDGAVLLHDTMAWDGAPELVEWCTWLGNPRPAWLADLNGPQFNLSSLAIAAALNHQGLAIGRTALVYDELKSGRLVSVSAICKPSPARYVLISRQPDDQRVAIFLEWVRSECDSFDEARMQLLSDMRVDITAAPAEYRWDDFTKNSTA